MVIIAFMSYPPESAKEMGKRFVEQPALPAYITMKGPYFSSAVREGIEAAAIYEVDQSKFSEAYQFIVNRYIKYWGVPGFTHSVRPWYEAKEALKALGMG
ncbi:MAG: hypothetical protein ABSB94_20415 [Syntrophorhabdales bacterium]|jgi:hypothetical protein